MNQSIYDVAILGGGPGGYSAALRAGQLGLKVALVEKNKVGGLCLHRGCIPTKSLLRSAEVFELTKRSKEFGIDVNESGFNWDRVQERKNTVVNKLFLGLQGLLQQRRVNIFNGKGNITKSGTRGIISVDVDGKKIEAKNLIIATGSIERSVPGIEIDRQNIITTDEALTLRQIPERILIIGGGASGVEFASLLRSFGSEVTVVEMSSHVLSHMDEEIISILTRQLAKRGIEILASASVEKIEKINNRMKAVIKTSEGKLREVVADKVLSVVGRKALVKGFGCENLSVNFTDKNFIQIDKFNMAAEGVYAIGDVVETPCLAHVAFAEGINVAEMIYGFNVSPINYKTVPMCTYSYPEVASVGLTEKEARLMGIDISIGKFPMQANAKAEIYGEPVGMVKIVSETRGPILGMHAVGPNVSELIGEGQLATNWDAEGEDMAKLIHAHPTVSESIGEAAMSMVGKALHTATTYVSERKKAA